MESDPYARVLSSSFASMSQPNAASKVVSKGRNTYERREIPCVLTVDGTKDGYRDDIAANLAPHADFATTFTYVDGPLVSPEVRIHLKGTEKRGNSLTTYIIARVVIPINALSGIPVIDHVQDGYRRLSMTVHLERIVLAKSKKPIDNDLSQRASAWAQLFIGTGDAALSIFFKEAITIDNFVSLITRQYSTDESRVIDAGLDCVFKNHPVVYKELNWFTINSKLPSPPDN
ncbi:hypothetical protein CTA2_9038, partial [Colletotrichum tanaceti]